MRRLKVSLFASACVGIALALLVSYLITDSPNHLETNDKFNMSGNTDWKSAQSVYDFTVKDLDGNDVSLEKYRGHPLIIVNVASKCGFTKANYQQLNEIYAKYKDQGLRILGFPCSQFMNQEPGCSVDIKEFIKKNNVEWDVFEKINVNGNDAHPLYNYLKTKQGGFLVNAIKWNFTKFLINKEGIATARFSPSTEPNSIDKDIQALFA